MLKKIIYTSLMLVSMLSAATVDTNKEVYSADDEITVLFTELKAQDNEWIAIYPEGSTNDFGNIITWKLAGAVAEGNVVFNPLAIGIYEVRIFEGANFVVAKQIEIQNNVVNVTTLKTTQDSYTVNEPIVANFDNMSGKENDWIAIYPANSNNDWGNMLQWKWIRGEVAGQTNFEPLAPGDYEVRVFFNNSFNDEAIYAFSVDAGQNDLNLVLNKEVYAQNELIYINYVNMQGNNTDWIGIYPAGAGNEFANVIDSKQTAGNLNGEISLGGVDALPDAENNPGGLAPGNYEVRAFYNNSLKVEKTVAFSVTQQVVGSTIYEAVNGSISPNWIHISGPTAPYYNSGSVNLKTNWINNFTNTSEYRLPFPQANTTQKVLELEAGGVNWQPHFFIGLILKTTDGPRKMIWDPFFTHHGTKAFKSGQYLSYPLYIDIQARSLTRLHVRLDVEKYLRILEPNNKVLSISAFMASGGDLDEIKLSSH